MANYTLEALISGDIKIVEYYNNAKKIWQEIRESDSFKSLDILSKELKDKQFLFEEQCGGRHIGQEIMVNVGVGQFYSSEIGFENDIINDVVKIKTAFAQSNCSEEVKSHVKKAAFLFGLNENEE